MPRCQTLISIEQQLRTSDGRAEGTLFTFTAGTSGLHIPNAGIRRHSYDAWHPFQPPPAPLRRHSSLPAAPPLPLGALQPALPPLQQPTAPPTPPLPTLQRPPSPTDYDFAASLLSSSSSLDDERSLGTCSFLMSGNDFGDLGGGSDAAGIPGAGFGVLGPDADFGDLGGDGDNDYYGDPLSGMDAIDE